MAVMKDSIRQSDHPMELDSDAFHESQVKQLIAQYKRGNERAFAAIVQLYRKQVAALAYRVVRDYDDAADVTQIVFTKMIENIRNYDDDKKFYTWLYRITFNASIDYLRKHRRHRHEPIDELGEMLESPSADPARQLQCRQLGSEIQTATSHLSDRQRSAILLRDVNGCKVDDIAKIMDMPQATVRWYLHRARISIRRELQRRCPHLLVAMGIR
jgi:RNA polymerase sigma-70 factor (ECF subfamily)